MTTTQASGPIQASASKSLVDGIADPRASGLSAACCPHSHQDVIRSARDMSEEHSRGSCLSSAIVRLSVALSRCLKPVARWERYGEEVSPNIRGSFHGMGSGIALPPRAS